ncbi:MAG TPA: hypothetical protein VHX38_26560 [Pseudonocardiaceae bacterium]|jgi:hypothetical protein|nr:hypothetical protein [Pseudonocardiaceae bacterium]
MGDGYRIEAQVLHEVLSALDRGGSALAEAGAALGEAPVTDLGTAQLDAVAGEFVAHWADAVASAHGSVGDTADGVRGSLDGYADTERWIAGLFGEDGSG